MSTGIYDPAIFDPAIYDTGAPVVGPTGFVPRDSVFSVSGPAGPVATVSDPAEWATSVAGSGDIHAEVEP